MPGDVLEPCRINAAGWCETHDVWAVLPVADQDREVSRGAAVDQPAPSWGR